ncbi:MAG: hypothetical protein INR73_15445 [Williamsia sp.]|nr:hypothetical protein [Williamsia sp.]
MATITTPTTTTTLAPVSFQNSLPYDIGVYDSFSSATESAADNNYFGQLTLLGIIKANSTGTVLPIRSSSAFIVMNALNGKPVMRCVKLVFQKAPSYHVVQADEDAMTTTFSFIQFMQSKPADPVSTAFTALIKENSSSLVSAVNGFFTQHPPYNTCTFQTYMMAVAYTIKNPSPAAAPSYSLSRLVSLMGGTWPSALPDISVTQFTCNTDTCVLAISAQVDLTNLPAETGQIASNFASLFGDKTVQISIQLNYGLSAGISGTRLAIILDTIHIPVGGGKTLAITNPEISIDINPLFQFVVFSISGVIPFNLMSKAFEADISMTIDNVEASIQASIQGDNSSFPPPPVMKGVHFDEFGVGIGVFFTPPGIALGLQGKFHIGDQSTPVVQLDDNTFVLVCSIEDEVPDPVYISFYVPSMDMGQLLEIFTNSRPAIDVPVTFTDISFKWAQNPMEPVTLPDGSLSQMGYGFSASASVANLSFFGDISLDLNNGLTANIEMAPLHIGNLVKLSGDGKGVTIKVDQNGNPIKNNQVATTAAMKQAIASASSVQWVLPGGPVLVINTLTSPILHLNARVDVFDQIGIAVEADINKDDIEFEVDFGSVLNGKMACRLTGFRNFYGAFQCGINRTISLPTVGGINFGSFNLNTTVSAHVSITTVIQNINLVVGGTFDFMNITRSFGDYPMDMRSNKIADLVEGIVQCIAYDVETIFHDLYTDVSNWARVAVTGILSLTASVTDVLRDGFDQTANQAAAVMKQAGFAANTVASGLKSTFNLGADGVASAMNTAGYTAGEVASALKNVFSLDQIASALNTVFGLSADAVNTTLKQAGYAASDIANAFKSLGGKFADVASTVIGAVTDPSNWNPLHW